MTDVVANIDFEAFSKVSLKDVGTCRYSEHGSTEVLCMGWGIGPITENVEPLVWAPGPACFHLREAGLLADNVHSRRPLELYDHVRGGGLVYAWNVEMEIPFWEEVMVRRRGWPTIAREQWRDTAAEALVYALPPGLDDAGTALDLDIVKDQRGKHLLNKLAKPRKPSKHNARTRWEVSEVPQDYADLYAYCAQDVRSERAVKIRLPSGLSQTELELWQMTTEMNLRGWSVDVDSAQRMLAVLGEHKKRAQAELVELTDEKITTGNQLDRMLGWMAERGVFLDNMQADTVKEKLAGKLPKEVRRLLVLRGELGKASTGKYTAMETRVCDDGTVKNNILHHGAATGRDAGRGLQIQNFVRAAISKSAEGVEVAFRALRTNNPLATIELIYGAPSHFASLMSRSHLIARDGFELWCADFAQVENRLAAWHARCEYGLQLFRDGLDEYKMFAAVFYNVDYDDVTEAQRQHSKHAVLLFIFGGGEFALVNQAIRFGTSIELSDAKKLKKVYRRELYPEVVAMWYALDDAAKECIRTNATTSVNDVSFSLEDGFLMTTLPSGRRLAYYDPMIEMVMAPWGKRKPTITHMGRDDKKRWLRLKLIPGRNFENVVQASARDQMMSGALRTVDAGYDLVGRIHDELVSERELGTGNLRKYCQLMATEEAWLRGEVPIVANGWRGQRFRK